jgi:ABC-type transporter Mla subunit MlaD
VQQRPELTKHQQAVAKAVATTLEPLLTDLGRKLNAISQQLDTVLAELAQQRHA